MRQIHNTFMQENNDDNTLIKLLKRFPNEKWVYRSDYGNSLSENPNITMEYVKNNLSKRWDWSGLSGNSGISLDDIKNNLQFNWHKRIIQERSIDKEKELAKFIEKMSDKYSFIGDLDDYDSLNIYFSYNPITNLKDYKYYDIENDLDTSYIEHTSGLKYKFTNMITKQNLERTTNMSNLIGWKNSFPLNKNMIHGYSFYYNPLLKVVKKNLDKPWRWTEVIKNSNLSIDFILLTKEKYNKYDWMWISHHPNMTWDIICSFPELPWNWNYVAMNPNLTYQIIIDNPKLWDFKSLSCNYFNKSKRLIECLERTKTKKIKRWKYIMELVFYY